MGYTWIMPLILQVPCFLSKMDESSGWVDQSSSRISSLEALCSFVNCSATILFDGSREPITARESPMLATYNVPLQIIPTKQHDPIATIKGLNWYVLETRVRNPSSVAASAFLTTSSDMVSLSWASSIQHYTRCIWSAFSLLMTSPSHYKERLTKFQAIAKQKLVTSC